MNTEAVAVLALTLSPGAGNVTINRLTSWASASGQSLSELIRLSERELHEIVPGELKRGAESLSGCGEGTLDRACAMMDRVEKAGVQAVLCSAEDYPDGLSASLGRARPPLLFVLGDFELLQAEGAGIVGTRSPSEEGIRLSGQCARVFSEMGVPVISGGAEGVDAAAHEASLEAAGKTAVVLPQGLLTYRGPQELLQAVEEGHAVLVSEFSPDARWSTRGALARNATIAALSRLVCVIEPGDSGGSVRTARLALGQGKCVVVHPRTNESGVMRELERAGARRLLGDGGRFNRARLLEAWAVESRSPAGQSELF